MGTLFVVATPIGNLDDISPRALSTLREVSVVAAEDTRHSRRLFSRFGISTPLVSYHRHNQRRRREEILHALDSGDVALISDAGTPAISDPGSDLVAAALEAGHRVSPIPGPSALAAAVSASGLIDGPFLCLGFLPRQLTDRRRVLARAAASGFPLVIFESALRLAHTLEELLEILGDRPAVLMRELTKIHEEVRSATLAALQGWVRTQTPRGELVLVVDTTHTDISREDDAIGVLQTLRRAGLSASQAAREAAVITGLPRGELYDLAVGFVESGSIRLEGELSLANEDALQDSLSDQECPER